MEKPQQSASGLRRRLPQYGDQAFAAYLRRTFVNSMGFSRENYTKPVIGVVNTFSELNHCHLGLNSLVDAVKRGVWSGGGFPLEFPVISLGEQFLNPSAMMFRNLMAMDVEAMLKAQPLDGVVLLGGCDKTLPAMLMGAASANLPSIVVAAGPMLAHEFQGERVGACTDCRRFWAAYRRGEIDEGTITQVEQKLAPTHGTCGVMGTASTMACVTEALGMMLSGTATIPAVYADRTRAAEESGRRAVELVANNLTPDKILTREAFENAIRVLLAVGGSTNAIIHLTAIAGRLGIRLELGEFDRLGEDTPVLVAVKPSGSFFMEDFHRAGGVPVVLRELGDSLHGEVLTVDGAKLAEILGDEPFPKWQEVIFARDKPFQSEGSLVVLRGNLAPRGAVLKRSAASPELLQHRGQAVVFDSLEDLAKRIDDPGLEVEASSILVLRKAGLVGGPGMPEAGNLPIPKKLKGLRDMIRISDARMSGTAFGTIVLHVAPEAAVGGALGLVETGDWIELDVDGRRLHLEVSDDELECRRLRRSDGPIEEPGRGYEHLFQHHVQQPDLGADFDFLRHPGMKAGDSV